MKAAMLCPTSYQDRDLPSGWPVGGGHWNAGKGMQSMSAALEMAERADDLGFDWVSLTEHHYSPRILSPNPMVLGGAVSQRVKRAKIAVLGPILPLVNPIRLAEEYAVLDNLSGGRLIAGFLRGIPNEFQTYGVNPAETRDVFEEALSLILRAWTEPEPFAWEGRHFRYRMVSVWPRPAQDPYPPIYMSGKAPESGIFAARHHFGMSLSFNSLEECLDSVGFYRQQCEAAGWQPTPDQVLYRHFCYVAETDEEAKRDTEPSHFGHFFAPIVAGPRANAQLGPVDGDWTGARLREGQTLDKTLTATLERPPVWEGAAFIGSPDSVLEQIRYAHDVAGIGVVDLIFAGEGVSREQTIRSLELFAREVLPRIRNL